MKNSLVFLIFFIFINSLFSQTKIILDTDFSGDADDLGALVMIHNFIDSEECELLGIMSWSNEEYAVAGIDAVNRFYKHADIPIGTRKVPTHRQEWCYGKAIADKFPNSNTNNKALDATLLYRQLLAKSKNSSVTIVTIGPLKNIENLINSHADTISSLSGKELIESKVNEFVIMGGQFPEGKKEWNFDGEMKGVTKFVINNIKKMPITFIGSEVGVNVKTGEIFNSIETKTPLYVGFMHFSKNAPWMKDKFKNKILNNSTYDQLAVLYAVRNGVDKYWSRIDGGYCKPDDIGGNKWVNKKVYNHSYLKLLVSNEKMATMIESLMLNRKVNTKN
jgi:inosine-uridine nucleoside N-ribohydrolase